MNFWVKLPKPFTVLAPMEGVTDFIFRQIIVSYLPRPDVFFTEFTSSDALTSIGVKSALERLKYSPKEHPIVAQIWGTDPEKIAKSSIIVERLGFDGIDLNMGCPDRNIMKKGSGAATIGNYELAIKIINAVKKSSKLPLSIKTRLGIKSDISPEWISFLLKQEPAALTLHARTAKQKSKGLADWEKIGEAVNLRNKISPQTMIIGNGDIKSYKEVLTKYNKYKMDGVMIGRGMLSNPNIFEKNVSLSKLTRKESLEILIKHIKLFTKIYGTDKNFSILKKYFKIYIKGYPGSNLFRQKLMECNSSVDALKIIKNN